MLTKFIAGPRQGEYNYLYSDSERLYKHNLKTLPNDWYWREHGHRVIYKINKQGFRMEKNFEDIDLENYSISLGCSYALGQGMPFDETYSFKITQQQNVDLVLLANAGHGFDTFFHNFFLFIETYKKLPKFVLIGHTTPERKTYWVKNSFFEYTPESIHKIREKTYREFLTFEANFFHDFQIKRLSMINFLKTNNIPYLEFTGMPDVVLYEHLNIPCRNDLKTHHKPLARDHQLYKGLLATHPGFEYQESVINYFNETIGKDL